MVYRQISDKVFKDFENYRNKIIVIYGARQVGKTTLIRQLLKNLELKILVINADLSNEIETFSSRNLSILKARTEGYDVLFIDEAQRIPDIGINLKILHEECPKLKIIISGSSSIDLAARTKEALTGRTYTHELFPISLHEWKHHNGYNSFELSEQINDLLRFGMYPEIFSYSEEAEKIRYLKSLSSDYLYKDILIMHRIKYPEKIIQLLRLLAFQIGQEVSIHELSKQLEIHSDAVRNYIDLLIKNFVLFKLSGFNRNLRKEVSKMNKIYFYDLGLRNAVIDNFNTIDNRNDKGQLWENFVLIEKIKHNAYTQRYANLYFWRLQSGAELDLIEEREGKLLGYEIKWADKKIMGPKSWQATYENASFDVINRNNFESFLL